MQADIWLTKENAHYEHCPLCSQPLKNGSTTCFSCGFSTKSPTGTSVWIDPAVYGFPLSSQRQSHQVVHGTRERYARGLPQARKHPNPNTPIPPRASAQASNAIPGSIIKPLKGQKSTTSGVGKQGREDHKGTPDGAFDTSVPVEAQMNSTVWEYEPPAFQASSSLPTLSLLISEEPTRPELEAQGKVTRRLPHIDEIKTVPPPNVSHTNSTSRSLVSLNSQHDVIFFHKPDLPGNHILLSQDVGASSWTAGNASKSPHARLISSRSRARRNRIPVSLNPLDRLRWWLLRPGHIEFVLWLGGTVLLVAVTCVLMFVTAFSFEWITPGFISSASTNTFGTSTGSVQQSTVVATPKMMLIRLDKGPILPGQSIELRGQGFSPLCHIKFLFDSTVQLFDQNGQIPSAQANARGVFTTSIVLDNNLPWHPGPHSISAQDLMTKRMATLQIVLAPAPIGKGMPNTPVPSSYPPNATPPAQIPIPTVPSSQPTPVGQTPVPFTPTPHPVTPTPTPTLGTTPTVGTSPTVIPTASTTPGVTTTNTTLGSGLSNALDKTGGTSVGKQLAHLSFWTWLMIACYCLSMVLLGLAGVLHKRQQ
jgi:hypothetical protein